MALAGLYARLRQKQEELSRLRICQNELNSCRQDFYSQETICLEPELSSNTWAGTLAQAFENIREGAIVPSYQDIHTNQFSHILQLVANKITRTEQEIAAIKQAIAAAKAAAASQ
ncbi:DUF5082 domain-containing protein [Alkalihalobacillus oceani]|uniref:YwqH-like family protein n=1 Tax=Halalkalibacter oceani TaxID=1653776 RepID=UPI00203CC9BB|nr:DUF5082 domain-containing protein [Halalkalibacter oceani]MCM3761162.1 DUF5082 domain-containing protein [Halalkalibacter oceani]